MFKCSNVEFETFVGNVPNLCASGLVTNDYCRLFKLDFPASRQELADSFSDFHDCCCWLNSCRMDGYATNFSPTSEQVLRKINISLGRSISHGVLVAAVLYLGMPRVMHGNSPGLSIGISRFCPHYHSISMTLKPIHFIRA
jgi:hypothetical protein